MLQPDPFTVAARSLPRIRVLRIKSAGDAGDSDRVLN
jgi:hypothetical protein